MCLSGVRVVAVRKVERPTVMGTSCGDDERRTQVMQPACLVNQDSVCLWCQFLSRPDNETNARRSAGFIGFSRKPMAPPFFATRFVRSSAKDVIKQTGGPFCFTIYSSSSSPLVPGILR